MIAKTQWQKVMAPTYGTPALNLVSGKGLVVTDDAGKKYLDFLGGIATNVLGHAHPAIVRAVSKQVSTLGHVSNFFSHPNGLNLASELVQLTGDKSSKVFFCNSGAEANEAALKLSRKTGKKKIVATVGSFHGRTMGALSLTGQRSKRTSFLPLLGNIKHVPFGDTKAMARAVNKKTAMVIVEPIMGEAGVIVPPDGYLKSLRAICDKSGALLVFDCVQTGIGRTGQWFGFEHELIKPDVITLAKGLGGGLPIGAMISLGQASELFSPGDHGTTFGGNPIATSAGLAVLKTLKNEKLLRRAKKFELLLKKRISTIKGVKEVRGAGLLIGIEFSTPQAHQVRDVLLKKGVIVNAPSESVVRIAPALTVTQVQIEKFIKLFTEAVSEVHSG
jgi:acetylornithine aminotransferase